ncbi:MAG TPA: YicC/YloC family endoribonuclease [Granulicella sp.]|nr:YicC/YloC family endoribonuclease [Granulicella sp.]
MSAVVYSMTGYASVRLDGLDAGAVTLSIKSVNHRFFDPQVRLPFTLESLDTQIRKLLKESVRRGHIEVSVQIERRGAKSAVVSFNDELLGAYVEAFRGAAARHGLVAEPNLNELLRVPGMLSAQAAAPREEAEALEPVVLAAMPELLAQFNAVRAEEGAALADALRAGMERLAALADEASALREGVRGATFERLRGRIAELMQGSVPSEERLLAEAALLAERSDVEEELVRLRTHAERFLTLLNAGGEVGKHLDFLVQELNREANTLLSKTSGASSGNGLRITDIGLEMKVEIERAKEQVQNLE